MGDGNEEEVSSEAWSHGGEPSVGGGEEMLDNMPSADEVGRLFEKLPSVRVVKSLSEVARSCIPGSLSGRGTAANSIDSESEAETEIIIRA